LRQPHVGQAFREPRHTACGNDAAALGMHPPHCRTGQHAQEHGKRRRAAIFAHFGAYDAQQRHRRRCDEQRRANEGASEFALGDVSEDRDHERIQHCMRRGVVHHVCAPQSPPFAVGERIAIERPQVGGTRHECHG